MTGPHAVEPPEEPVRRVVVLAGPADRRLHPRPGHDLVVPPASAVEEQVPEAGHVLARGLHAEERVGAAGRVGRHPRVRHAEGAEEPLGGVVAGRLTGGPRDDPVERLDRRVVVGPHLAGRVLLLQVDRELGPVGGLRQLAVVGRRVPEPPAVVAQDVADGDVARLRAAPLLDVLLGPVVDVEVAVGLRLADQRAGHRLGHREHLARLARREVAASSTPPRPCPCARRADRSSPMALAARAIRLITFGSNPIAAGSACSHSAPGYGCRPPTGRRRAGRDGVGRRALVGRSSEVDRPSTPHRQRAQQGHGGGGRTTLPHADDAIRASVTRQCACAESGRVPEDAL